MENDLSHAIVEREEASTDRRAACRKEVEEFLDFIDRNGIEMSEIVIVYRENRGVVGFCAPQAGIEEIGLLQVAQQVMCNRLQQF